jgi:hypothetical protein
LPEAPSSKSVARCVIRPRERRKSRESECQSRIIICMWSLRHGCGDVCHYRATSSIRGAGEGWKRQNATGLFFVNIQSNSFISSIIVISRGVVMCMDGWCYRKRPIDVNIEIGEIVTARDAFFGCFLFIFANKNAPKIHSLFRHFQSQRPMQR